MRQLIIKAIRLKTFKQGVCVCVCVKFTIRAEKILHPYSSVKEDTIATYLVLIFLEPRENRKKI